MRFTATRVCTRPTDPSHLVVFLDGDPADVAAIVAALGTSRGVSVSLDVVRPRGGPLPSCDWCSRRSRHVVAAGDGSHQCRRGTGCTRERATRRAA